MRISVCIATYNGERYIYQQLESILPQLGDDDEVVISDDGSTDQTFAIIEEFNDQRISLIHNNNRKGPIYNFENAITHAQGKYIFLSDQDDKWMENKVAIMLKALEDCDLVVSNAIMGDGNLNVLKSSYFEWRRSRIGFFKNLVRNSYLGCCMAFDRKILSIIIPFPNHIPMHDMWIGMIAEIYFKPKFINDKLIIYRRHGGNATFLNEDFTSNKSLLSKLKFRFDLLLSVIGRVIKVKSHNTKPS